MGPHGRGRQRRQFHLGVLPVAGLAALVSFGWATQLSDGMICLRGGKAVTLVSLGRRDEAISDLRAVIESDPGNLTNARAHLDRLQRQ